MLCCAMDPMQLLGFPLRCPHPKHHQFRKKSGTFSGRLHKLEAAPPFSATEGFSLLLSEESCSQQGFIFFVACRVPTVLAQIEHICHPVKP